MRMMAKGMAKMAKASTVIHDDRPRVESALGSGEEPGIRSPEASELGARGRRVRVHAPLIVRAGRRRGRSVDQAVLLGTGTLMDEAPPP